MKSLLRDLCSALGPYCIRAKWLVFSDTVTYIYRYILLYGENAALKSQVWGSLTLVQQDSSSVKREM